MLDETTTERFCSCLGRRRSRVQISAPRPIYFVCSPPLRELYIFVTALVDFSQAGSLLAGRFQRYQRSNQPYQDAIGGSLTHQAGDLRRTQVKVRRAGTFPITTVVSAWVWESASESIVLR